MSEKEFKTTGKPRRLSTIQQQISEQGKLPPQATDLEEAVLGAIMLEKDALTNVVDILHPESFYKDEHQRIYGAIQELFSKSQPVDILTVTNTLKQRGELELVGGAYFITQLTNRVASAAHVEYHARIIIQKYIQRELIRMATETIKNAYDETTDVFDLLDDAEKNLYSIVQGNIRKDYDKMSTLIGQAIKQIEIAKNQKSGISGVPSGFTELDKLTSGWQGSDLIILAARPAMGKTAFVLTLARNAAVDFAKPVAIFSLEMSSLQLVNRLISSEAELSSDKLRKGQLEEHEFQQLNAKIGKLAEAPIFIDDTPALSVFELRAKARRLKENHNISMVVIDYLQLMTAGGENKGNREQEISTISRSLKSLAKELNIPVIALSQLSRAVETRGGNKKPQLSDLRESGAIEQDADMVMFLYRPEYYGMEGASPDLPPDAAEVIIAKHRNGSLKDVPLRFIGRLAKFVNLDSGPSFSESTHYNPAQGLQPSDEFGSNIVIKGSKMNDIDEEAPF
ncbi:MAG: replicative DNA helicase [Bacteroidetes bacterium]|nr:replicative DNA helicase [Bacteroidota bacterium]